MDSPNSTSLYSLVGNNRFTSISLSSGIAIVTPSLQDYFQFQHGDVLGFYVENANNHTNGVVIRVSPSILTKEMIWFASIPRTTLSSNVNDCFYSVGENGNLNTLTHAAPVISIETGQYVDKVKIIMFAYFFLMFILLYHVMYIQLHILASTFPIPTLPNLDQLLVQRL